MSTRAHWNILSECNLPCAFCYLWRRKDAQIWSTKQALELIGELSKVVRELVFGGGDQLMRSDLITLVEFAKNVGLRVELHTNAQLIDEIDSKRLFRLLHRLGLSMDGQDAAVHDSMRGGRGNFAHNLKALSLAEEVRLPTTVRTLVTRRNAHSIDGIADILLRFSCVEKWSLRQFAALGRGAKSRKVFEVSDRDFDEVAAGIARTAAQLSPHFEIGITSQAEMANCYCLITEDGVFYTHPADLTYREVGRFPQQALPDIMTALRAAKQPGPAADAV